MKTEVEQTAKFNKYDLIVLFLLLVVIILWTIQGKNEFYPAFFYLHNLKQTIIFQLLILIFLQ